MITARPEMPFVYQNKNDFSEKLMEWIGDVFYEILPQKGYEIREEQIYTAFQIAEAVCKGKVHLAEAGLGTGKTFAYLTTAVAYARFKGRPVIIACASTALQEQLAGPQGDIEKLSQLLGIQVDVRMAKDPHQYICDEKVNRLHCSVDSQPEPALDSVLQWAAETNRGERTEMPSVPDRMWRLVAWDEDIPCETCSTRGFCKLVKGREHYRAAVDLLVCDHRTFFNDLWTREEKIDNRKLPLLPEYCAVIFDEGHKVQLPAALSAGRNLDRKEIDSMILAIEKFQGARTSLISTVVALDKANSQFFKRLYQSAIRDERTDRLAIRISDGLLQSAATLRRVLDALLFEFQNEQALNSQSLSDTWLTSYEGRVERGITALDRFCRNRGRDVVVWADGGEEVFWVVPRDLSGMFKRHLLDREIPIVFSSATLGTGGNFSYFAGTLGLKEYSSSTVSSAFDYENQVLIYLPKFTSIESQEDWFTQALTELVSLLKIFEGRALVLTNTPSDVAKIREGLKKYQLPYEFLWEDSGERGYLIRRFRQQVSSVLVGSGFWEGIDVPGEALSLLVIWRLPFPPQDPLVEARKSEVQENGLDPVTYVEYPEMSLRLKQGCGRLIRSQGDRGVIAILEPVMGTPWDKAALGVLPEDAKIVRTMEALSILQHPLIKGKLYPNQQFTPVTL